MNRRYILEGHTPVPCPKALEWAAFFAARTDDDEVAHTALDGTEISTQFLGIDHNRGEHGEPLLFETLVCGGPLDGVVERYSTWDEAEAGHARWTERCQGALRREALRREQAEQAAYRQFDAKTVARLNARDAQAEQDAQEE